MTTGTRLDPILASVRARSSERRTQRSITDLRHDVTPDAARRERFVAALRGEGLAFIAECKRRSPSVGTLSSETDLTQRAHEYARGGAAALSILTEQDHFHGSPDDLAAVAGSGLPRLRKDFVLDEGMVLESVGYGADAILLLAVCLPDPLLGELRALAGELGLATLVEVHNEHELERALAIQPDCLGVNARDLTTFEVDLATMERLVPQVPNDIVRVAESGIHSLADAQRARSAGADAALVGEALMRAESPAARLIEWREGTRDV